MVHALAEAQETLVNAPAFAPAGKGTLCTVQPAPSAVAGNANARATVAAKMQVVLAFRARVRILVPSDGALSTAGELCFGLGVKRPASLP